MGHGNGTVPPNRIGNPRPIGFSWRENNGCSQERVYCCCQPTNPTLPSLRADWLLVKIIKLLRGCVAHSARSNIVRRAMPADWRMTTSGLWLVAVESTAGGGPRCMHAD